MEPFLNAEIHDIETLAIKTLFFQSQSLKTKKATQWPPFLTFKESLSLMLT